MHRHDALALVSRTRPQWVPLPWENALTPGKHSTSPFSSTMTALSIFVRWATCPSPQTQQWNSLEPCLHPYILMYQEIHKPWELNLLIFMISQYLSTSFTRMFSHSFRPLNNPDRSYLPQVNPSLRSIHFTWLLGLILLQYNSICSYLDTIWAHNQMPPRWPQQYIFHFHVMYD